MPFDPHLAAIRFGTGLSPLLPPPGSGAEMLARLRGPDEAAARWPIPLTAEARPSIAERHAIRQAMRDGRLAADEAKEAERLFRQEARAGRIRAFRATLARMVGSGDGLRERLALFWADHFTVVARDRTVMHLVSPFVEEAVRPHVAGRFGDMLAAVTLHPMMLTYLDQARSIGPGSPASRGGRRGLNENLARELLELHTVGVRGPYGQGDVRELAELLTGLGVDDAGEMAFRPRRAEPGAETVLGETYGEGPGLGPIREALADLAAHPATAAHLARKLAVHFVSDAPEEGLVAHLADAFLATGGDLGAVTEALLARPEAWAAEKAKVKPPVEFVASALRAMGMGGDAVAALGEQEVKGHLLDPLALMGQPWQEAPGPDGWPEEARAWVTPQFVAGRIDWAMRRPERICPELPDPRDLAAAALGPGLPEAVAFAARAAERRGEGVAVVLASAEFQRR